MNFTLGLGQTIKALELGLMRVCVGEEFEITAPAEKAYGEKGKMFSKAEAVRQFFCYILMLFELRVLHLKILGVNTC